MSNLRTLVYFAIQINPKFRDLDQFKNIFLKIRNFRYPNS